MQLPHSQTELALRDTLITKAENWALDALAERYGFKRPAAILRRVWRNALRAVAFGHRGTLGTTWAALELGFRSEPTILHGFVDSASPHRFTRAAGAHAVADNPEITCRWLGRFVRLRYSLREASGDERRISKILYIVSPVQDVPATGPYPGFVEFAQTPTGLWTTEDCSDPLIATGPGTPATLELLPFTWKEPTPGPAPAANLPDLATHTTPPSFGEAYFDAWTSSAGETCLVDVLIESALFSVPPTYLLDPAGVDRDVVDPNMPEGGIIMDMFGAVAGDPLLVEAGDPLGDGPSPIYLIDEAALTGFETYFDPILASGCHFTATVRNFCLFEGTGFPYLFFLANIGSTTPPGAPTAGANGLDYNGTGRSVTQTVWPYQNAFVFSGGTPGSDDRILAIHDSFTGPVTLMFTVAQGALAGTNVDAPETGEDLVLEYSTDLGANWTTGWTGLGSGSALGWEQITLPFAAASEYMFRWKQSSFSSSTTDEWAISMIRVVEGV